MHCPVEARPFFEGQYLPAAGIDCRLGDLFFAQGIFDGEKCRRYIFGKQQHIVARQEGLEIEFAGGVIFGHSLHIQGVGEHHTVEGHFPYQ